MILRTLFGVDFTTFLRNHMSFSS